MLQNCPLTRQAICRWNGTPRNRGLLHILSSFRWKSTAPRSRRCCACRVSGHAARRQSCQRAAARVCAHWTTCANWAYTLTTSHPTYSSADDDQSTNCVCSPERAWHCLQVSDVTRQHAPGKKLTAVILNRSRSRSSSCRTASEGSLRACFQRQFKTGEPNGSPVVFRDRSRQLPDDVRGSQRRLLWDERFRERRPSLLSSSPYV